MNKSKVAIIGISIAVAIGILVAVFVSNASHPAQITTLKLGHTQLMITLPIYVALEKGYFKDAGFDVSLTSFQSSNQLAEAVAAGNVDGGGVLSASVVLAIEQKSPSTFKVLVEQVTSSDSPFSAIVVRKDSNLTLSDLSDKKIALFPGSTALALTKIGFAHLLDKDFKFQPAQMPPNLWLEALTSGQVDAVVGYEPFNTLATQKGVAKILYSAFFEKTVMDDLPGGDIILSSRFIQNNPQAAAKIEEALGKAIKFIGTNEGETRMIATKHIPIDESVALKSNLPKWYVAKDIDTNKLQQYADLLLREGDLQGSVNVSTIIYEGAK